MAEKPVGPAEKPAKSAEKSVMFRQILDKMENDREYSAQEIGNLVHLQGSRTRELLKQLVESGDLEATGDTKGRRYSRKRSSKI